MILELVLVIAIIDGDTIKILDSNNKQIKVRLAYIDAPESKQPFGNKSKIMLSNMIAKKRVNLECSKRLTYQRKICKVIYKGIDINRQMVAKGGAWVYRQYYKGTDYYYLERSAEIKKIGLWKTSEYQAVPPWDWRKYSKTKQSRS